MVPSPKFQLYVIAPLPVARAENVTARPTSAGGLASTSTVTARAGAAAAVSAAKNAVARAREPRITTAAVAR